MFARKAMTVRLCAALLATISSAWGGGIIGDLVTKIGEAVHSSEIAGAGKTLDDLHAKVKDTLPPYKIIEEAGSKAVRDLTAAVCGRPFESIVAAPIVQCSNWDGRLDDQDIIKDAMGDLVQAKLNSAGDFSNIQIRWCPSINGGGLTPSSNKIYLDPSYKNKGRVVVGALLAHEMTHIKQFRDMGEDQFKCAYSIAYTNCGGCQDRNHPLEAQAYAVQDLATATLRQYTKVPNGQVCQSDAECRSGSCYPGPYGDGHNYCSDRNTNCSMPGTAGVMYGSRFTIRGLAMMCKDPHNGQRAQILPTKTRNGETCNSNGDCESGTCYPGPGKGDPQYCMNGSFNCAFPGRDGVNYGFTAQINGRNMRCQNPGGGSRARVTD